MIEFKASLINELEKLYKKKKALIGIILSFIFVILGQAFMFIVRNSFGLRGVSSAEFPILILSIILNTLLPLFIALITIDSFCSEFSQNTMKITLTRPVTRIKIFTAKICAITIFIFANLMFVMLFSTLVGFIFNANFLTFFGIIKIIISYCVTLIPMIVLSLVVVFFSNIIKSGIGVFFLSILVFLVFNALEFFFSTYSGLFFTSMLGWYNLWIMDSFPLLKIIREFMIMSSYAIILFTLSYYLFDKKDF